MGTGWHGHFPGTAPSAATARTLTDNLAVLKSEFHLQPSGYFGVQGESRRKIWIRNIEDKSPLEAAQRFFTLAAEQACSITDLRNQDGSHKGYLAKMRDGTRIAFRWRSTSDGTSVIEINIKPGGSVKYQKIHFVEKKGELK